MVRPIFLVQVTVIYAKSEITFEMVSTAKTKDTINDYGQYVVARNISTSKKDLNNKYQSIFEKCKILEYKILKQIGETNE